MNNWPFEINDRVILLRLVLSYLTDPCDPQRGAVGTVTGVDPIEGICSVWFDGFGEYGVTWGKLKKQLKRGNKHD